MIESATLEGWVAYTTAATSITLPASATTNVYISVNTTTAAATVTASSTPPSGPYLLLATLATGASTVTTALPLTPATRALPENVDGKYLKLTGGTVAGDITANRLLVAGKLGVGGTDTVPNMPLGARLGGNAAMARCYSRVYMEAAQNIATRTWTTVNMTGSSLGYGYQGAAAHFNLSTNRFTCPVAGAYTVTGNAYFSDPSGSNVGRRIAAVVRRNTTGAVDWMYQGPQNSGGVTSLCGVNVTLDCGVGSTLEMQVYQDQGTTLQVVNGGFSNGTQTWASFTLVQAF